MQKILSTLRFFLFWAHLGFVIYLITIIPLKYTGIIPEFSVWDIGNISLLVVAAALQLWYRDCPLTVWMKPIDQKLGNPIVKDFLPELLSPYGIQIPVIGIYVGMATLPILYIFTPFLSL